MIKTSKSLRRIEEIVSDDFCQDMEWLLAKKELNERESLMVKKLGEVYKISHAHSGTCGNPHNDWKV